MSKGRLIDFSSRLKVIGAQFDPDSAPTFGCYHCKDIGVTLREVKHKGSGVIFSRPCQFCEYGEQMRSAFASWSPKDKAMSTRRQRNRKLGWMHVTDVPSESAESMESKENHAQVPRDQEDDYLPF